LDRNEPQPYIITVLLTGLFAGSFGLVYFMGRTFIIIDLAALYVILFGLLAFGVHYLIFKRDERYLVEVILYSVIGWGMIMTAGMLGINFLFHNNPVATTYVLKNGRQLDLATASPGFEIKVEDPAFDDFGYLLSIQEDEMKGSRFVQEAVITQARGFFGYNVILKKELR
jgi:hypothetical protein